MSDQITITLPFPPSVNGYWRATVDRRGRPRNILSKRGREYRTDATIAVAESGHLGEGVDGRLEVTLELYPPDKHKRDVDNYCKGVLDAMTHAGVWLDDEQVDILHVFKRPPDKANPRVVLTFTATGGKG